MQPRGQDEGQDGHDEAVEEEVGEEANGHGEEDEGCAGAPAEAKGWGEGHWDRFISE